MNAEQINKMEAGSVDAVVAEKVMGWTHIGPPSTCCGYPPGGPIGPNEAVPYKWPGRLGATVVPHYSTDIAAAWEVVEKMRSMGWYFRLHVTPDYIWAGFDKWTPIEFSAENQADAAPLAICRAALLTVMGDES